MPRLTGCVALDCPYAVAAVVAAVAAADLPLAPRQPAGRSVGRAALRRG